jgi:hypothetical protein
MIKTDKILHFLAGYLVFSVTDVFCGFIVAGIITLIAGISKELYDKFREGENFDIVDLVCTLAGGFFAFWIRIIDILKSHG